MSTATDLDPATLGRVTTPDLYAAATWLLDGYEYDADDDDPNAAALARVGHWLIREAARREQDATVRALAPQSWRARGTCPRRLPGSPHPPPDWSRTVSTATDLAHATATALRQARARGDHAAVQELEAAHATATARLTLPPTLPTNGATL